MCFAEILKIARNLGFDLSKLVQKSQFKLSSRYLNVVE